MLLYVRCREKDDSESVNDWMKWLRYQSVISLEAEVEIITQKNKWANTDNLRWAQDE
jgi:hypothetical protein